MKLFNAIAAATVITTSFVAAQAFTQMPGQAVGNMASLHIDMDNGIRTSANDGDDRRYHTYKGNTFQTGKKDLYAYPSNRGQGPGHQRPMDYAQKAAQMQELQRLENYHGLNLDTGTYKKKEKLFGIF